MVWTSYLKIWHNVTCWKDILNNKRFESHDWFTTYGHVKCGIAKRWILSNSKDSSVVYATKKLGWPWLLGCVFISVVELAGAGCATDGYTLHSVYLISLQICVSLKYLVAVLYSL